MDVTLTAQIIGVLALPAAECHMILASEDRQTDRQMDLLWLLQ